MSRPNVGELVLLDGKYWVIIAVNNDHVYIRPSRFDDHIPDRPHYKAVEVFEKGKLRMTLLSCKKPFSDEQHNHLDETIKTHVESQDDHAREHASKQQPGEQLSLFSTGVGE